MKIVRLLEKPSLLIILLLLMYQFRCVTPFTWILPCLSKNQFQMYNNCLICHLPWHDFSHPLVVHAHHCWGVAVIGRKWYIPQRGTAEDNVKCSYARLWRVAGGASSSTACTDTDALQQTFLPTNTTYHVDYKIPEFFWRMIKRIKRNPWKTATVWAYQVFILWLYHVS